MMKDDTLKELRAALDGLATTGDAACPWAALTPLAKLDKAGYRLHIDIAASKNLRAPLVIARPELPDFTGLSPRQQQVAKAVWRGLSNAEIADELCISVATVKDHVHAILSKLGLKRRGEIGAAQTHNQD